MPVLSPLKNTLTGSPSTSSGGLQTFAQNAPAIAATPGGGLNSLDATTSTTASADAARGKLVQDPVTGLWMDPSSRAVFQNVNGKYIPVHDLNMSAQVAKNIATADAYGGLGKDYDASLRATMAEQGSLADQYRKTISDPNAPSVAREQLNQALGAADATQLSGAAGASGENAFLARRNASQNMAGLAANAGQADALVRAQEVATAQQGLGTTLGAEAGEAGQGAGLYSGLARDYSGLASGAGIAGNTNATNVRGQNIGIGKDVASGLSGPLAPKGGGGGGGLNFNPPAGPDDIAQLR